MRIYLRDTRTFCSLDDYIQSLEVLDAYSTESIPRAKGHYFSHGGVTRLLSGGCPTPEGGAVFPVLEQ